MSSASHQSELRYLAIGRIVRAHGILGEVSVTVLTDFPERYETTEWVYIGNETDAEPFCLKKHRWHKKNVLLTLDGVTSRTQAEKLTGQLVQIPFDQAMPLPKGSYYLYQLVGLQAVTEAGENLGVIADIIETGANDVYVVKNEDGKELLLPAIPQVVKHIDPEKGRILVNLIDGLI